MEILLSLSIALAIGLLATRVVKPIKFPAVTGYLVSGLLIGPYLLGRLGIPGIGFHSVAEVESYSVLSKIALGFIAFAIGNEFRLSQIKKIGKKAAVVGVFEAFAATLFVNAALIGLHFILGDKLPLHTAILLGAIASATAPAATLMVIRQYKAKGAVTNMLLPIVALDDALCLIIFAVSAGVARAITSGSFDVISIVLEPLLEIVLSVLLGLVAGLLFAYSQKFFYSNSKRTCLSVTFVLLVVSLSMLQFDVFGIHIAFSPLLSCMMLGTVFCNACDSSEELMEKTDKWTMPFYILFFVLSGAELDLSAFSDLWVVGIGLIYILFRSLGKYLGAFSGSKLMKCEPKVCKYLGITLLPQAGVALGMSLEAVEILGEEGILIRNIVLFAVLIYELFGPLFTKIALVRSGDIQPKDSVSNNN